MKTIYPLFTLLILIAAPGYSKLSVITTTTDLRNLVEEVGKENVSVEAIAKGTQDPHFIEAKPSFMVKASRADLVISVGMDLEIGWLPSIIQGARNPSIQHGKKGFLEVGLLVEPLEVPKGAVSRAEGDVHPFGNPHVTLDPIRAGEIAGKIAERLGELDPPHLVQYATHAKAFQTLMASRTKEWKQRVAKSGVKSAVTYHKTLTYFLDRFEIQNPAILEPKPGIPPTSSHILDVIRLIREKNISLVLVENFFAPTVTDKIKNDIPALRSKTVAVSVDGRPGVRTLGELYESLIQVIEGKE